MSHKDHQQPPSTTPIKTPAGESSGNAPVEQKPLPPPPVVASDPGGLLDHGVPVHPVKPVPRGSLPVGQEGGVGLRFIIQPDGVSAQVFGSLEGTGGASVDFGVLPCITVG